MGLVDKLASVGKAVGAGGGSQKAGKNGQFGAGVGNVPLAASVGSAGGGSYLGQWGDGRLTNIAIVVRAGQVLMAFILLIIVIVLTSFQSKWISKPSGLSIFLLICTLLTFMITALMLGLSFAPHKLQDKADRMVRVLEQPRLGLVMNGAGAGFWLLLAMIQVISAYTLAGCKDGNRDPHAESSTGSKEDYLAALEGFCRTKKAGAVVCWLLFILCTAMLAVFLHCWRTSRKNGPRIPPFVHPDDGAFEPLGDDFDGEEHAYDQDKEGRASASARYGEGGDGRYGDARYGGGPEGYQYNGPYDADPRIAKAYGLTPQDMQAAPQAQGANPFSDQAATVRPVQAPVRQSYDYGAYNNDAAGYPASTPQADPYAAIQHQLRTSNPQMPPHYGR